MIDLFTLLKDLQTKAEAVNDDHPTLFQSNIIIPLRPSSFSTIERRGRETRPDGTGHQTLKMVGKIEEMRKAWINFCFAHQQCSGGLSSETWNTASITFQKRDSKITLVYKNKGALSPKATDITVKGHINIAKALQKHAQLDLSGPCFLHHIHTERGLIPLEVEAPTPALALARLMCLRLKSYKNSRELSVSQVAPYHSTLEEAEALVNL